MIYAADQTSIYQATHTAMFLRFDPNPSNCMALSTSVRLRKPTKYWYNDRCSPQRVHSA